MAKRPHAALGGVPPAPDRRAASDEASSLLLRYLSEIPPLLSPPSPDADAAAGVESWLASARREVGTAPAADAVAFNVRNGGGTDHPEYDPVRYLVWSVGSVLLPMLRAEEAARDGGSNGGTPGLHEGDDGRTILERYGDAMAGHREAFRDLVGRPHASPDGDEEGEAGGDAAGAFWQVLVRAGSGLGPEEATERLDGFEADFLEGLERASDGTDPGAENLFVGPEAFAHPAFLRRLAGGGTGLLPAAKRRRLGLPGGRWRAAPPAGGDADGALRWALLGYSAAYAALHVPAPAHPGAPSVPSRLSSGVSRTLCRDLGAPARGRERAAALSGMAACLLDEVCERTANDDGLLESWREGDGGADGEDVLAEMRDGDRSRPGVDQVVGLILEDPSALSRLAGLIGESPVQIATTAADVLLCYSRTARAVTSVLSGAPSAAGDGAVPPPGAADDAREVVRLLGVSCPVLVRDVGGRTLRLAGVYSEEYRGRPHPVTVLVTAHCAAGMPRRASEICALVEKCPGIDADTKQACYYPLFEHLQDTDRLFEHDWPAAPRGSAHLGNLPALSPGRPGLMAALEYLRNVAAEGRLRLARAESAVLRARDAGALSTADAVGSHRASVRRAEDECRCVKDAVRRTALRLLGARAPPGEALAVSCGISDSSGRPALDTPDWRGADAAAVAVSLLRRPSMLAEWNERCRAEAEEAAAEEAAAEEAAKEAAAAEKAAEEAAAQEAAAEEEAFHDAREQEEAPEGDEAPPPATQGEGVDEYRQLAGDVLSVIARAEEENLSAQGGVAESVDETPLPTVRDSVAAIEPSRDAGAAEEVVAASDAEAGGEETGRRGAGEEEEAVAPSDDGSGRPDGEGDEMEGWLDDAEAALPPAASCPGRKLADVAREVAAGAAGPPADGDTDVYPDGPEDGGGEEPAAARPGRERLEDDEEVDYEPDRYDEPDQYSEEGSGGHPDGPGEAPPGEGVIELGDTDDESDVGEEGGAPAAAPPPGGSEGEESDGTRPYGSDGRDGGGGEEDDDAAALDIDALAREAASSRGGRGDYSASDGYSDEDAAEEDRRVAFHDEVDYEYDDQEGDDSANEGHPQRPGGQDDVVDLLDSSSEEEEECGGPSEPERERRERAAAAAEARRLRDAEEAAGLNERVDGYLKEHPARDGPGQWEDEEEYDEDEEDLEASPEKQQQQQEEDGDLDEEGYDSAEGGKSGNVPISRQAFAKSPEAPGEPDGPDDRASGDESGPGGAVAEVVDGGHGSAEEAGGGSGYVPIPRKMAAPVESPSASAGRHAPDDADGAYSSENNADDEHTLNETEESEASQVGAPYEEDDEDDPDLDAGRAAAPAAAGSPPPDAERADHQEENVLVAAAMSSQQQSFREEEEEEDGGALSQARQRRLRESPAPALPEPCSPGSGGGDAAAEEDASAAATAGGTAVAGEDGDDAAAPAPAASDEYNENPDDCGYMPDAEATEEEKKPSKAKGKAAKAIDPGYLPDAEATEEEQPGPKKEEKPAGTIDPGYEAEASEVEAADAIRSRRDLREQEQRRPAGPAFASAEQPEAPPAGPRDGPPPPPPVTSAQSIDDGYLPTDDEGHQTDNDPSRRALLSPGMKEAVAAPPIDKGYEPEGAMTEEERDGGGGDNGVAGAGEKKPAAPAAPGDGPAAEDDGYHADGNTDAGDATEEDQPTESGAAPSREEADGNEAPAGPPPPGPAGEAEAGAMRTANDEVSSEGYLAGENTEEDPSETEERNDRPDAGRAAEDGGAEGGRSPPRAAVGNVLVTTATVLQRGGHEAGGIATRMDDDEDGRSNELSIADDGAPLPAAAGAAAGARPVGGVDVMPPPAPSSAPGEMAALLSVRTVDDTATEADGGTEEAGPAEAAQGKMAVVLAVHTSPPDLAPGGSTSLTSPATEQGTRDRAGPGTGGGLEVASEGLGDGPGPEADLKPSAKPHPAANETIGGDAPEAAEGRTGAADEAPEAKPPAGEAIEDREAAAEAADPADPPADGADDGDGSTLTNFPACLPGDWNVGKSKKTPTYRRSADLSGWVEQLIPRKADKNGHVKFHKHYLCSDGGRFRSLADARKHVASLEAGVGPAGPGNDGDGSATVGTGTTAGTAPSARGRKRRSPRDLALDEHQAASAATVGSRPSADVAQTRRSARKRRAGAAAAAQEGDTPISALTAAEEDGSEGEEDGPLIVRSAGGEDEGSLRGSSSHGIPRSIVAVRKGPGAAAPLASVPEDGTLENDKVKGDGDVVDEAADPPAEEPNDASTLTNFPACLPGDWNVGKSKRTPTYRKSAELSGWVEQLVPRKATDSGQKYDKYYLYSDGERFRSLANAQRHAASLEAGGGPAGPGNDGDGSATVGTGAPGTAPGARGRKRRSPRDLAPDEHQAASAATPGSKRPADVAQTRRSARKRRAGAAAASREGDAAASAPNAEEIPKVVVAVKKGSGAAAPLASVPEDGTLDNDEGDGTASSNKPETMAAAAKKKARRGARRADESDDDGSVASRRSTRSAARKEGDGVSAAPSRRSTRAAAKPEENDDGGASTATRSTRRSTRSTRGKRK